MLWLSYIIPMYNSEAYVSICLDSILKQGLEEDEYEVIVVNDGSTDRGGEIVNRYCKKHANFRLINKENGGVSSARNVGIEEAKGEYIYFIDSDDRLLPKGMQIIRDCYLNKYPKTDLITIFSHTVDKHYEHEKWEHIRPHKMLFHGTFLEYGNKKGFGWSVYSKIISRRLIIENKLRFAPYLIGEDTMFAMRLFTITNAVITATNLDIYRYCVRSGSILTRTDRKHLEQVFSGYIEIVKEVRHIAK
ncbi:MAG: glycosyltransferase [Prevotella sp.]|nr:glycosyltransferase [Prevotella sp.]